MTKKIVICGLDSAAGKCIQNKFTSEGWDVVDFKDYDSNSEEKIDALLTAGGDISSPSFEKVTPEEWNELLNGWLGSVTEAVKAIAPKMVKEKFGNIIVLSPDFRKMQGDNILSAAAAGTLHGFMKSLGVELAESNVLANCLWAELPYEDDVLADMAYFMAEKNSYISAQVIALKSAV